MCSPKSNVFSTQCGNHSCQLHVSVDDLKSLFWDDPQKMWVGKKVDMVVELVKMLYFEYTLETEVKMEVT